MPYTVSEKESRSPAWISLSSSPIFNEAFEFLRGARYNFVKEELDSAFTCEFASLEEVEVAEADLKSLLAANRRRRGLGEANAPVFMKRSKYIAVSLQLLQKNLINENAEAYSAIMAALSAYHMSHVDPILTREGVTHRFDLLSCLPRDITGADNIKKAVDFFKTVLGVSLQITGPDRAQAPFLPDSHAVLLTHALAQLGLIDTAVGGGQYGYAQSTKNPGFSVITICLSAACFRLRERVYRPEERIVCITYRDGKPMITRESAAVVSGGAGAPAEELSPAATSSAGSLFAAEGAAGGAGAASDVSRSMFPVDTRIHDAIVRGASIEEITTLLSQGVSKNAVDSRGQTALHYAAAGCRVDLIAILATPENINYPDKCGESPLFFIDPELLASLRPETTKGERRSAMIATLEALMTARADINMQIVGGAFTPLHAAISKGLYPSRYIRQLLEYGAKPNPEIKINFHGEKKDALEYAGLIKSGFYGDAPNRSNIVFYIKQKTKGVTQSEELWHKALIEEEEASYKLPATAGPKTYSPRAAIVFLGYQLPVPVAASAPSAKK